MVAVGAAGPELLTQPLSASAAAMATMGIPYLMRILVPLSLLVRAAQVHGKVLYPPGLRIASFRFTRITAAEGPRGSNRSTVRCDGHGRCFLAFSCSTATSSSRPSSDFTRKGAVGRASARPTAPRSLLRPLLRLRADRGLRVRLVRGVRRLEEVDELQRVVRRRHPLGRVRHVVLGLEAELLEPAVGQVLHVLVDVVGVEAEDSAR